MELWHSHSRAKLTWREEEEEEEEEEAEEAEKWELFPVIQAGV